MAEIPGLKSCHQMITPDCRANRGVSGAFIEAVERLQNTYSNYARAKANDGVTWHLLLVRQEAEEACPGHVALPGNTKVCAHCGVHIDSLRPD